MDSLTKKDLTKKDLSVILQVALKEEIGVNLKLTWLKPL